MKILVAGAGAFGREHLRTLAEIGGMTLAVADPRPAARQQIGALFPIALDDGDGLALIDRFVPDGIIVATPAAAHAPLATAALARNIPVLVEKPVAPDSKTMALLCGAAADSRAFLQPGHILRFSAPHRRLRDMLAKGRIGDLLRINSRRYRDEGHVARYSDMDPVFTTMIHDIDLALWFDGSDATELRATRLPRGDYRSLTVAEVTSSRGAIWHLSLAWLHPALGCPPDRVELIGTLGSIEFEAGRGIDIYTSDGHGLVPGDDDDPLRTELLAFLAGIRAGRLEATVTPDDALRGLQIAERIVAALGA